MADIRVRNLDDKVVAQLKDRARMHGISLEGELREVLTDIAMQPRREIAAQIAQLREAVRSESGKLSDSATYIREERDNRG